MGRGGNGRRSKACQRRIEGYFWTLDEQSNTVEHAYGDRRQEIVFIGTGLQRHAVEEGLDKCLLSEMEMANYSTNAPIGYYPDPLQPLLVSCDGPFNLFIIARPGQNQHIGIVPGFKLTLHSLALNLTDESYVEKIRAVKVWLHRSDVAEMGVLLATLRPDRCEQHSLSLQLLPCDREGGEEDTSRRIRVEVVPIEPRGSGGPQQASSSSTQPRTEWMNHCEIHIVGKSEPLPYSSRRNDDVANHDDDGTDATMNTDDERDRAVSRSLLDRHHQRTTW